MLKVMTVPARLPPVTSLCYLLGFLPEALDHTCWVPAETAPPWNAFPTGLILVSVADCPDFSS